MVAASVSLGGTTRPTATPIEQVRAALSRFPLWKLYGATAYACEVPDLTNPGGYYHQWVVMKYKTWFGIAREKVVYFEQTAFDERKREEALNYLLGVLKSIQVF